MTAAQTQQPHPIPAACTVEEARALTDQIRGTVERTWLLLVAAHERQAWKALGYTSFQAYLEAEFGIKRSRAYQLLAHSTVVREIAVAADVHSVDIPEGATRGVKPHLTEVADRVREAVADVPDEPTRAEVAEQVVRDAQAEFLHDRRTGEVLSPEDWAAQADPAARADGPDDTAPPDDTASPADEPAVSDGDGWSPSDALDRPASKPSKPTPSRSTRPLGLDEQFRDAAIDLRRVVNRLEQLSADGRLSTYAQGDGTRRGVRAVLAGLDDAAEGIGLVLTRLRDAGAAA